MDVIDSKVEIALKLTQFAQFRQSFETEGVLRDYCRFAVIPDPGFLVKVKPTAKGDRVCANPCLEVTESFLKILVCDLPRFGCRVALWAKDLGTPFRHFPEKRVQVDEIVIAQRSPHGNRISHFIGVNEKIRQSSSERNRPRISITLMEE